MNNLTTFFLSVTLILCAGCVETITMDPHEKNLPIAVHCVLTEEPVQKLDLRYVRSKASDGYAPVEDARPCLVLRQIDKQGNLRRADTVARFTRTSEFEWTTEYAAQPSKEYELFIRMPNKADNVSAITKMPNEFKLSLYEQHHPKRPNELTYSCEFNTTGHFWIYASDVRKTGDYYWYTTIDYYNKKLFEPFCEYLVTDCQIADRFNITTLRFSDLKYQSSRFGVLIYMQKCLPNAPVYSDFIRIDMPVVYNNGKSAEDLNAGIWRSNRSFFLGASFKDPFSVYLILPEFYARSLSDEYDKYLREVYVRMNRLDNDLTEVYRTQNLYSNVNGGVGIFGAVLTRLSTKEDVVYWPKDEE